MIVILVHGSNSARGLWALHKPSFKMKIQKDALHDALVVGRCCESENKMETRTEVPEGVGLQIVC